MTTCKYHNTDKHCILKTQKCETIYWIYCCIYILTDDAVLPSHILLVALCAYLHKLQLFGLRFLFLCF